MNLPKPIWLLPAAAVVLTVALSATLTTCHTSPAGILTKHDTRQVRAHRAAALLAARHDSAAAVRLDSAAAALRQQAQVHEDSATYFRTHALPAPLAATDTAGIQRIWASIFK